MNKYYITTQALVSFYNRRKQQQQKLIHMQKTYDENKHSCKC